MSLWRRLSATSLATRIGIAVTLTLAAVQIVNIVAFLLVPRPHLTLFQAGWIADAAIEAYDLARRTRPEARVAALEALPTAQWLQFSVDDRPPAPPPPPLSLWQPWDWFGGSRPPPPQGQPFEQEARWPFDRLLLLLRAGLDGKALPVILTLDPPDSEGGGFAPPSVSVIPPGADALPVSPNMAVTRETVLPPSFVIGLPLESDAGRSWVVVQPKEGSFRNRFFEWNRLRTLALFVLSLVIIAVLSVWMARSMLKPLRRLATAAERLGRERAMTPIEPPPIREFAAIARAFNDMQVRLKRFVDERTMLLAAISHDLRTPLTRLRLVAEYLDDPAQRRQVMSDIAEMETMVEATLTFASEEAKREDHRPVDIASLLISLCDDVTDDGGEARYVGPDHATGRCQPVAMRRALANIIRNGVKYGGAVTVSLVVAPKTMKVLIEDNGPGIAPEDVERAFAPFQRLETSRSRETGGTGLGLTIARDIISGHGGNIVLEPRNPGQVPVGLRVSVTLPR
ncbi:ATP-binding protein [Chelatococcus asaccharovorans]|uniref:ATP-binding protein n=1 Tax=Chelatococcus asaccharovorans TaxID=28210 RepID=UPI00224C6F1C|nr:ATP-binding protein [Chelatococcus asaccharovorans]CAH1650139.1 Histidine kinase [Chelatococcus asaccharovorans]CAH1686807.1 Histidine kinase [Chelatococcus asaccharovorans]